MTSSTSLSASARQSDTVVRLMAAVGVLLCLMAAGLDVLRGSCPNQMESEVETRQKYILCEATPRSLAQGTSIVLLALGSALIGAGITQVVAGRRAKEMLDEVGETIQRTVAQPAIYSSSEKVSDFRRKLYSYHETIKDGQLIWRSAIFDFTDTPAINRLLCVPQIIHQSGEVDQSYSAEAFIRGAHFVLVVSPSHSEPKYMRIYPTAGFQFRSISWGISTHMDFDEGRGLFKCLLATSPMHGINSPGLIDNSELIAKFEDDWHKYSRPWRINLSSETSQSDA